MEPNDDQPGLEEIQARDISIDQETLDRCKDMLAVYGSLYYNIGRGHAYSHDRHNQIRELLEQRILGILLTIPEGQI